MLTYGSRSRLAPAMLAALSLGCGGSDPAGPEPLATAPAPAPQPVTPRCSDLVPVLEVSLAVGRPLQQTPAMLVGGGPEWECHASWAIPDAASLFDDGVVVSVSLTDRSYDYVSARVDEPPGKGWASTRRDLGWGEASVLGIAHAWSADVWEAERKRSEEASLQAAITAGAIGADGTVRDLAAYTLALSKETTPTVHELGLQLGRYQVHYVLDGTALSAEAVDALLPAIRARTEPFSAAGGARAPAP
jgi:hypothetical protein